MMVGSGIGMAVMTDLPAVVFQGHGTLPADFMHLVPRHVHGIVSILLALLLALHVGAALVHQFIKKDNLIARMWFGKK
jgi:cytochrome b561